MNARDILERFQTLRTWRNRDNRAPHKPLLIIWMIGRCLKGDSRLAPFELVDLELTRLLQRFGPAAQSPNTHYPFWRLRNDEVWEIDRPHLVGTTSSGDVRRTDLIQHDIHGGLKQADYDRLRKDPALGLQVATSLLEAHFPESLHDEILRATGFDDAWQSVEGPDPIDYVWTRSRKRDSVFRSQVLAAYAKRCAVCEFDVRVTNSTIAVEAAHIRWHSCNGPDEARNGVALCSLHHRLFDCGTFTVLPDLNVFVSGAAQGQGYDESLGQYHENTLRVVPALIDNQPAQEFLKWHRLQVFRTPEEIRG